MDTRPNEMVAVPIERAGMNDLLCHSQCEPRARSYQGRTRGCNLQARVSARLGTKIPVSSCWWVAGHLDTPGYWTCHAPPFMVSTLMKTETQARTRILFVDDDETILRALARMLKPDAYRWDMTFIPAGPPWMKVMSQRYASGLSIRARARRIVSSSSTNRIRVRA